MPEASKIYLTNKLNDTIANISSDETILYELNKHVDAFNLNSQQTKLYFNETDLTINPGTKIWINSILPDRFPNYHCHDCYEFNLIFEGKCIEIVNGNVISLEKGDILILPSNTVFHTHFLKSGGRGCNVLVKPSHIVTLRDATFGIIKDNFLDILLKKNGYCIIHTHDYPDILKDMEELVGIFKKVYELRQMDAPPSDLMRIYTENTFYRMLIKIFLEMAKGKNICNFSDITTNTASSEEIITYIKDNHATVTMPMLSKKFGYSLSQLDRIIKKHTGNNFVALTTYERIAHAKNLLKNTSLPISEISKAVGLDSKAYFSKMFKKQTSMTPTEYRIKRKKM